MLRSFLARVQAALQSLSRAERHRRRVMAELVSPLPALSASETAEVAAMDETLYAIRTGEFPVVVAEILEERPGIYTYPEPIGPNLPTVDEQFAAFEADPLAAPLPGAPAKTNPHFAATLAKLTGDGLPREVAADLEKTGSIDRGFLAALARGER
jgi:hypothetical protein